MPAAGRDAPARPFPRERLAAGTLTAARSLLGALLVRDPAPGDTSRERRVGRIVEVEAYIGEDDRASHARFGPTDRNRVMFGPPGIAYVYLVYGMHHCLNVVTEPAPRPAALLVRAVEPVSGMAAMRAARAATRPGIGTRPPPDARLAAGPGLVCAAFSIDRTMTGLDLCDSASPLRLEVAPDGDEPVEVVQTPRIGIDYAGEPWAAVPWRFLVPGSPSLSGRRPKAAG